VIHQVIDHYSRHLMLTTMNHWRRKSIF